MKKITKILLIILVFVLACTTTLVAGGILHRYGGASSYGSPLDDNNYDFTVSDSNFDSKGYYMPAGVLNSWKIQVAPAECERGSQCVCGSVNNPDLNLTEARGWPLPYGFYHITCGSLDVYTPLPLLLDFLMFAVFYTLLVLIPIKLVRILRHHNA